MNYIHYIVGTCSLMAIVFGFPITPFSDQEVVLCNPELINFVSQICENYNLQIKNATFKEHLISECCFKGCTTNQIFQNYCIKPNVNYINISTPSSKSTTVTPPLVIDNEPLTVTPAPPLTSTTTNLSSTTEAWGYNIWFITG